MKRILTAVVLIPLVLLVIFRAPIWLFTVVIGMVALIATHEYLNIVAAHQIRPFRIIVFIAVALWFFPFGSLGDADIAGVGQAVLAAMPVALGLVLLIAAMRREPLATSLPSASASYLAFPYIASTLGAMVLVRVFPFGALLLLYLLLVVWAGDTAAYYTGRAIGRHKLAPRISPGKTWEGTAASLLASIAVGTLVLYYVHKLLAFFVAIHFAPGAGGGVPDVYVNDVWRVVVVSASINIAAQLGDLVESMIKRGAHLKDSGTLLPGHGGMLDRIDALLFAAPVLWYYAGTRFIYLQ